MKVRQKRGLMVSIFIVGICVCSVGASEEGLIAHWKFDEGEGTIAYDSAGDNHGTLYGDPNWVAGEIGSYALDFDGAGDYVQIPDDDSLTPGNKITIAFWLYNRGGQNAGIYKYAACPSEPSSPGASRAYYMHVIDSTGKLRLRIFAPGDNFDDIYSNNVVSLNQWHHIAGTFDAGEAAMYIDGQLDNSDTMTVSSIWNDAQPLIIGGYWEYCGGDSFVSRLNGKADDVRIYDRALSPEEVQNLYEEAFDPATRAINKLQSALDKKEQAMDKIDEALDEEQDAKDILGEMLQNKDYGDLKKRDILKALQETRHSMRHENFSLELLDKSLLRLEDALLALGWQPPTLPDPIAHWTFDEGSGTTAYDYAGDKHGTVYGAVWTSGQINGALNFDGADDYVGIGDSLNITNNLTVSAWICAKGPSISTVYVSGITSNIMSGYKGYGLKLGDGTQVNQYALNFSYGNSSIGWSRIVGSQIPLDNWTYVVATKDSSSGSYLYINGNLDANDPSLTQDVTDSTSNLHIGHSYFGSDRYFNGTIDDVRVYDRALTAGEIEQLYQQGE